MTPSGLRVGVILNEGAGAAASQGDKLLREQLEACFASHGIVASIDVVPGSGLREAAERAFQATQRAEFDALVIGGGDGSIRTVASVIAGSGVALGILPLGTRNHFARDLALPLAVEEAIAVIASGVTRSVDIADVNGQVFINNSSIGVYPYLVLARERKRRDLKFPKWAAMILALPQVIRYFPVFRLTVRAEGQVQPYRSSVVFVGNNEYQLTLPMPGKRERLDGSELWVYVANVQRWPALLWRACRTLLGIGLEEDELCAFKGPTVEITSRRHHILMACDGEVESIRPPLRYRCRPGALRVYARDT